MRWLFLAARAAHYHFTLQQKVHLLKIKGVEMIGGTKFACGEF